MSAKRKTTKTKKSDSTPRLVWFEIPADDIARARKFYSSMFGWKIKPFPGMKDYMHIDTGGSDETLDGGLMVRKHPQQPITNYVAVPSVEKAAAKVRKLGGQVCVGKTPVPGTGYFVVCQDTEKNVFALWERNEGAKP
jgi:predicted enzyme related to lactoylglutathione lyase